MTVIFLVVWRNLSMSVVRGIRGATTVENNCPKEIISVTQELLLKIQAENQLNLLDVISIIFTMTDDLDAEFPAVAARKLGWNSIPLLCTREIPVIGSLQKCIRILMHVNTNKQQIEMKPVYLKEAVKLRPDQIGEQQ
jgi:chorismate mutase